MKPLVHPGSPFATRPEPTYKSGKVVQTTGATSEELSINVAIQCGGVVVNPGDFIVADLMGVTVVPLETAAEVVKLAREPADREEETRKWVAKGKTVEDLLKEFGRI